MRPDAKPGELTSAKASPERIWWGDDDTGARVWTGLAARKGPMVPLITGSRTWPM